MHTLASRTIAVSQSPLSTSNPFAFQSFSHHFQLPTHSPSGRVNNNDDNSLQYAQEFFSFRTIRISADDQNQLLFFLLTHVRRATQCLDSGCSLKNHSPGLCPVLSFTTMRAVLHPVPFCFWSAGSIPAGLAQRGSQQGLTKNTAVCYRYTYFLSVCMHNDSVR
jgi:hypothetical protein